ncbi:UNVERIFIED_CONTAM: hypothetical protein Sangu_1583800 [Sesamum angustifolium]|uniref:DUF4283 domain-containing protein n=1 Tax=Sesamum angustifolium TaxID=2727405 RepID=A0AAW2MT57_9LAMI
MANSTGRLDSANGAPPVTAPFSLNSADFPPLTSKSATHSELTHPDSIQSSELPAHLFRKDALFAIARNIGMPLQIADSTFNQSNLANARVCVEIDLLKPLLKEMDIQICGTTIVQSIVYEHIPSYCSQCKHVGHRDADCYLKGNAPKPPPDRRHAGKKNVATYHKLKGKALAVYKVLDKKPIKNPTVPEVGECSENAVEHHRSVSESVVHNDGNEIIHADNVEFSAENGILNAENENSVDANNSIRVVETVNEIEDTPKSSFENHDDGNGNARKDKIDEENACGVGPVIVHEVTETVGKNIGNTVHVEDDTDGNGNDRNDSLDGETVDVTCGGGLVWDCITTDATKGMEIQLFDHAVKPIVTDRKGKSLKQMKTEEVYRLIQKLRKFGVVCHVIKYALSDKEKNPRALFTGPQFDTEVGEQGVPSPKKPSPIASRTRCRRKGKNAPAVHSFFR